MRHCIIVGAGDPPTLPVCPGKGDLVIGADGGYGWLKAHGIPMNLAVGDFDSLEYVPNDVPVLQHPVRKDDTDMLLAVKTGFGQRCTRFDIFGGTGGRLDHTIANLQTLLYIAKHGGVGILWGGCQHSCVLPAGKIFRLTAAAEGTVSVFAFGGTAEGVSIRGLSYALERARVSPDFPIGVSNACIGQAAEITVEEGYLLIQWSGPQQWLQEIGDANP